MRELRGRFVATSASPHIRGHGRVLSVLTMAVVVLGFNVLTTAAAGAGVYWTNADAPATVMTVGLNGGTPQKLASNQGNPVSLALDDGR